MSLITSLSRSFNNSHRGYAWLSRSLSTKKPPPTPRGKDRFNYNESPLLSFLDDPQALTGYPRRTADDLASNRVAPTRVKMLARDFIHDSLYNPHYGYFAQNAVIFTSDDPFDFNRIENSAHFQEEVAQRYVTLGGTMTPESGLGKQVWHTPTELFKPWYGQAIAQCLVSEYLENNFPYEDLVIYEVGAGNGTNAQNILDYIRDEYPQVYERTQYIIIEISKSLAALQRQRLCSSHAGLKVVNQSIFDWRETESSPCYIVALEVVDNFAHDVLRFDLEDLRPYQGLVAVDDRGDFFEVYEPVYDPLITQFLDLRSELRRKSPALSSPLLSNHHLRKLYRSIPFAPNVTPAPEYIPTKLLAFIKLLRRQFPLHRLLLSDFSSLPDAIPGYNAPVVQTRFRDTMVPVETLMVQQGYFDIFFPTSFDLLREIYELVMSKPPSALLLPGEDQDALKSITTLENSKSSDPETLGWTARIPSQGRFGGGYFTPKGHLGPSTAGLATGERASSVYTHQEFMKRFANLEATQLQNGENPLLDYYCNVKVLF